jgi:hypothetical protein
VRRGVDELVDRRDAEERDRAPDAAQLKAQDVVIEVDDPVQIAGDAAEVPHPLQQRPFGVDASGWRTLCHRQRSGEGDDAGDGR